MVRRAEDSSVWIGYADFLTTLAVLFFVVAVSFAGKRRPVQAGFITGSVQDVESSRAIEGCLVQLGQGRQRRTDASGSFEFRIDSVREESGVGLLLECQGYGTHSEIVSLGPGDTTDIPVRLRQPTIVAVETLPGDALFGTNAYVLKAGADSSIRNLGLRWRSTLAAGDVIAVQGHSDDVPFPLGSGKDNWMLSGERAAAAARVLTSPAFGVGIPPCQVVIMGFGPSRPVEVVRATDDRTERARKRARNRRIEFRMLKGTDISGSPCGRE